MEGGGSGVGRHGGGSRIGGSRLGSGGSVGNGGSGGSRIGNHGGDGGAVLGGNARNITSRLPPGIGQFRGAGGIVGHVDVDNDLPTATTNNDNTLATLSQESLPVFSSFSSSPSTAFLSPAPKLVYGPSQPQQPQQPQGYIPIGVGVVEGKSVKDRKTTFGTSGEVIFTSTFNPSRDVTLEFLAEKGKNYVLIPSTFRRGVMGLGWDMTIYVQKGWEVVKELVKEPRVGRAEGEWKGVGAGGCPNHCTWMYNPQFSVVPVVDGGSGSGGDGDLVPAGALAKPGTLEISLKQQSDEGGKNSLIPIGMFVFSHPNPPPTPSPLPKPFTSSPPLASSYYRRLKMENVHSQYDAFINKQTILLNIPVKSGQEIFPLVVLPCAFERGAERKFSVEVLWRGEEEGEEVAFAVEPVKEYEGHVVVEGGWKGRLTGGCRNNRETWLNNPLFIVKMKRNICKKSNKVHVRAVVGGVVGRQPCGVEMFEKKEGGERGVMGRSLGVSKFGRSTFLEVVEEWGEGGEEMEIVVMPCTFRSGVEGEFVLGLFSLTHTMVVVERLV